jgi:glycosyltransferase involved in cell wall biosynthesis
MSAILIALSAAVTLAFFLYGYNCYFLLYHMGRYAQPQPASEDGGRPRVAIHLPIYNERYVVSRLVDACAGMAERYGAEAVRIVIVDDSDDDTAREVDRVAARARSRGFRVEVLRRESRTGFKAGALQFALESTSENFITVFDADFLPDQGFLVEALRHFDGAEDLGIVQGRWEHINAEYSALTRAIALGIDVHFFVEQSARSAGGFYLNFNGSGGVIRREALIQAGGWQCDTLAEDLDMSYRLQMRGFRILYLRDLRSPAEVPATLPSYKRQQARWANGSLRVAKKLLPSLFAMHGLGLGKRAQALLHLTYYLVHPLMFLSFLLAALSAFTGEGVGNLARRAAPALLEKLPRGLFWAKLIFIIAILLCTAASFLYPLAAIRARGRRISANAASVGILALLGFGLSLSNTIEAAKALFSRRDWPFSRTPKYAIHGAPDRWEDKRYQVPIDGKLLAELLFALLGFAAVFFALRLSGYLVAFILMVYSTSFAFVAALTLLQSRRGEGA